MGPAPVPLVAASWLDIVMSDILESILGPQVATRLWSVGSHWLCGQGLRRSQKVGGLMEGVLSSVVLLATPPVTTPTQPWTPLQPR